MTDETVTVLLPNGSEAERGISHKEVAAETGMTIAVPHTSPNERAERLMGHPAWAIIETN